MRKFYSLLAALLLAAGVLAGCGESAEQPEKNDSAKEEQSAGEEKTDFPVTIKDAIDEEVVIESKPERIVSLIPSNTEIAFELGLGEEVVGVSDFDNYPSEATEKEKIGGQEFNVEKIISLSPELVLAHESTAELAAAGLQQLKDAGIPVLVVNNAENFDQVFESIMMIGEASGEKAEAENLVEDMKKKLEEIKAKAAQIKEENRKSVYVEVAPAPEIYSPGKNTFMDEMLSTINAKNAVTEEGWVKIDPETIVERNPDVIVTTYGYYTEDPVGEVVNRDGWQDVSAVKDEHVTDVDSDMVTRSGPRIIEGVEELARAVYPETFK
ncbi:ABC transporter substrate-binding protein [Bacillus sp. ISL-47]|uniref:ABC transporter substrate-binding protein n=1 Tax=Bacillus sp. ISL-47 TaxID=2819130 RepID=UPI001BE97B55|nr:ABC transporter substrate-binding protein [Bacillus sp. ISL-47]MBT2689170.1 ABC transporter substrate-binding protein [Bacillus sp. ISL-47]MBT2710300.1 ABC transporter substrate-binding protein [Pseudomonas sp. ISL-84]